MGHPSNTEEEIFFSSMTLVSDREPVIPENPVRTLFRHSSIQCLQKLSEYSFPDDVFNILPKRERAILDDVLHGMMTTDIAVKHGLTQGAISSRLKKAARRILFYMELPKFTKEEYKLLGNYLFKPEVDIVKVMLVTTCQSIAAEYMQKKYKIGCTQIQLRYHWKEIILRKVAALPQLKKFLKALTMVDENLSILHEVPNKHVPKGRRLHESYRTIRKTHQERYRCSHRSLSDLCRGS